ncbi:hypothetical protein DO62_4713 [Burkholderia pseudomallei]|nr:hypothetical protein DO62_4713 [Burkholderia pseudomallei]
MKFLNFSDGRNARPRARASLQSLALHRKSVSATNRMNR